MSTYDDKTLGAIEIGRRMFLPSLQPSESSTFKASYIIGSSIKCTGKITALFDFFVLGDIEAREIEVKGKFLCLGNCAVEGSVIVNDEMWVNNIQANQIFANDYVMAKDIDAHTIETSSNILVGKLLAVEGTLKTTKKIICGETIYGSGLIIADTVLTGEPIDLDGGVESIISPHNYKSKSNVNNTIQADISEQIEKKRIELNATNNCQEYLQFIIHNTYCVEQKRKYEEWKRVLNKLNPNKYELAELRDLSYILWVVDICNSEFFKDWPKIHYLLASLNRHFAQTIQIDKSSVYCKIDNFDELLNGFKLVNKYNKSIDFIVYSSIFDTLSSYLGLKAKFVTDRLNDKGWGLSVE